MGKVELRNKGVSFNIRDPQQKELYDYCMAKSNFSGYVKNLVLKDMLGVPSVVQHDTESSTDYSTFF